MPRACSLAKSTQRFCILYPAAGIFTANSSSFSVVFVFECLFMFMHKKEHAKSVLLRYGKIR